MDFWPTPWLAAIDAWVAALLLPITGWILLSGLDDLFLSYVWVLSRFRRQPPAPSPAELRSEPEKLVAIFLPLWNESGVIRQMVEHNAAAIHYSNYVIFAGAYPNDPATIRVLKELAGRVRGLHVAMCPHDGPTSKADCLNWIFREMKAHERLNNVRFDIIVTHDAEDLIHPDALRWINYYCGTYDMVQVPVLPLPTPVTRLTHGVYCDEFAESQSRDFQVRQLAGGFLPSSGVGAGFRRRALDILAERHGGRIFEPACLTEDYENGFRIHALGGRQVFLPVRFDGGLPVATREFFPRTFRQAVRQRTRWVTGIALQGWQFHGWAGGLEQVYWHWRDRKGLIGNPVSLAANLAFFYGLVTCLASSWRGCAWGLAAHLDKMPLPALMMLTLPLIAVQVAVRMTSTARLYGWAFALAAPLRIPYANFINALASLAAMWRFTRAVLWGEPLAWTKTHHAYPGRLTLVRHRPRLGDLLVKLGYVGPEALDLAVSTQPRGVRLGDHMIESGLVREDELYEALSLQQGVPLARIRAAEVPRKVARSLPRHVLAEWRVLPFRIADGKLHVAGPDVPREGLERALRRLTRLEVRFHLVTPTSYRSLARSLL